MNSFEAIEKKFKYYASVLLLGLSLGISVNQSVFAQTSGTGDKTSSSADTPGISITAEQQKDLLLAMGEAGAPGLARYFYPSLGAGIPSGFGANWGDLMLGLSASNADKIRDDYDGAMSFTMGLGNSAKLVGVELSANNLSIRDFGANWSFSGKVHRILYQGDKGFLSLGVGRNGLACSGSESCSSTKPAEGLPNNTGSNFAVLSGVTPVKNPLGSGTVPLSASFGMGNGFFSSDMNSGARYSPFGDIGIQLHNQVGLGVGWSGVGLNANISFVPVREWPAIVNILFADITDRSPGGFNIVASVGIPFNFLE